MCDHRYKDILHAINTLKAQNRQRAECLAQLCPQVGAAFYIAKLERTEEFDAHGVSDPSIDSNAFDKTTLELLAGQGRRVAEGIRLVASEIIQLSPFGAGYNIIEVDQENCSTTYYHDLAVRQAGSNEPSELDADRN